jgi:hypothetical protein
MILTVTGADAGLVQLSKVCVTVKVPAVDTVIEGVLSASLHVLPDDAEELSMTLVPAHMARGPLALIVGAGGIGLTVTTAGADGGLTQPLMVSMTVYDPDA